MNSGQPESPNLDHLGSPTIVVGSLGPALLDFALLDFVYFFRPCIRRGIYLGMPGYFFRHTPRKPLTFPFLFSYLIVSCVVVLLLFFVFSHFSFFRFDFVVVDLMFVRFAPFFVFPLDLSMLPHLENRRLRIY